MTSEVPEWGQRSRGEVLLWALDGLAGLLAFGLLAVAALRLVAHDVELVLVWFNSFTLYIYAPAYLVLLFAWRRRRRGVAVAACLVVVAHLTWCLPDYLGEKVEGAMPSTEQLFVASANLLMVNRDLGPIFQEIEEANPDIVFFQEFTSLAKAQLEKRGFSQRYAFTIEHVQEDSFGTAIFSRLPLEKGRIVWLHETPMAEARVVLPGGRRIRLVNVHTVPPRFSAYMDLWEQQLRWLRQQAETHDGPLILMGDFNATQHSRFHGALLRRGMSSAHVSLGRGSATTFPNGRMGVPPIRLDHLFFNEALRAVAVWEGTGEGSDHRPLFARISLAQ